MRENLYKSLEKNLLEVRNTVKKDDTVKIRVIQNYNIKYGVIFIDGMVNSPIINESVIRPIVDNRRIFFRKNSYNFLTKKLLYTNNMIKGKTFSKVFENLLFGSCIVFIDGIDEAIIIDTKGFITRTISEPQNDKGIKGPREGFNENILTNLSLVRRKIQSDNLKFEFSSLGKVTKTKICYCYIDNIVDKKILKKLKKKVEKISLNGILDTNYIEEIIKDNPYSPFKTSCSYEKPDIIASKLLEGKVCLFVDGSPFVMSVPYFFIENFQASDDYYLNYYYASFFRLIRIISFFICILTPAIYISLISFHKYILPTSLAIGISIAREGVPIPAILEAFLLIFAFEILSEATVRMPSNLGQALSIVGALVVGQAAVEARLVSAPMVIIIALSAITELMIPKLKGASIILRFIFLALAGFFGMYGVFFAFIALIIHILYLSSFGISYTSNFISLDIKDIKDTYFRLPFFLSKKKSKNIFKKS